MRLHLLTEPPNSFDFSQVYKTPFLLRPVALMYGRLKTGSNVCPLSGGPVHFTRLEVFLLGEDQDLYIWQESVDVIDEWMTAQGLDRQFNSALARLVTPRSPFASLSLERPRIMGIINVTSDSFYGESRKNSSGALDAAFRMIEEGADIIDIGGESTRPGSNPTTVNEELDRVVPVLERLQGCGAKISVDTRRTEVMEAAINCGVKIINDINALEDRGAVDLVSRHPEVSVILMHSQGTPTNMQKNPSYVDVCYEIFRYLEDRITVCQRAQISLDRIAIDPGFGFGKSLYHNTRLLTEISFFHGLGCPILIGLSRKTFVGELSSGPIVEDRLPATIAASVLAQQQLVHIHRVHDVKPIKEALRLSHSIMQV